jgi:hypothetical protein
MKTEPTLRVLSLGAGVQSSTMALMAAHGELPMPTCAIFSDTGDEPAAVYRWLDQLERLLPFPVYRVTEGKLSEALLQTRVAKTSGNKYLTPLVPGFIKNLDGEAGLLGRQCTYQHKIKPLHRKARALMKEAGEKTLEILIGISTDEVIRMKPARQQYITHKWPLIEIVRMSRWDCLRWMEKNGYPVPPRSACVFCPFQRDEEWKRLKTIDPEGFSRAVAFDKQFRKLSVKTSLGGEAYLHRSLLPLDEVDFDDDNGQPDLFNNECEGMCGV